MPFLNFKPKKQLENTESAVHMSLYAEQEKIITPGWKPLTPTRSVFFSTCANSSCTTGRLRPWRSRSAPYFENGWNCSADCTETRLRSAINRELHGRTEMPIARSHRLPLGLILLEQGWISPDQLRHAVDAQKAAGNGKLGYWLQRQQAIVGHQLARALGIQWSCPVLSLESHNAETLAPLLPRLFVDAYGALPLRVAAGKLLYLGFEDRPDSVIALALEHMTGLHVESGVVREVQFQAAHKHMLRKSFPPVELIEASSEQTLVQVLTKRIERLKPINSKMIRVHNYLWLRLWISPQRGPVPEISNVQDFICLIKAQ